MAVVRSSLWMVASIGLALGCAFLIFQPTTVEAKGAIFKKILKEKDLPEPDGRNFDDPPYPDSTNEPWSPPVGSPSGNSKELLEKDLPEPDGRQLDDPFNPDSKGDASPRQDPRQPDVERPSSKTKAEVSDDVRAASKEVFDRCKVTLTGFLSGVLKNGVADEVGNEIDELHNVDDAVIEISKLVALTPKDCFLSLKTFFTGQLQSQIAAALDNHPEEAKAPQEYWSTERR